MYVGAKIKKNKNPKENANLLSKIFFIFALKTIRKGICHDFKEEDVYEIMEDYRSEKLGKHIEELWNLQLKGSNPSLMRCLIKMFGIEYMLLGLAFFTYDTSIIIIQPILTGKLISYFEPNTEVTQNEATMYATGILASTLIFFLLHHTYMFLLQQICLKVKICLCALVYRKCLKLNLSSLSSQFSIGMPVTLITKDTMQFDGPLDCGHMFFNGTLQLFIMTTLMYSKIGVSALVGALFLFILMPIQVYLGYKMSTYRIKTSAFTDERVRITQEILTAIRIIKMYTWELFFSKVVNKLRTNELKNLRKLFLINAIATSIGQLSSRIAFYLCVMSYIFLGNHITAENAFFITGAFSAINMIFNFYIPLGVGQLAEIKASFNRLTSFLLLAEVPSNFDNIKADHTEPRILFENVSVQSNENVNLLDNLNLNINSGLTILTGYTGSGKSTIFKVIFGDIKTNIGTMKVSGNISYASQEPWVFPGSIKQNITFGEKFNQERYEDVIEVCSLKRDFNNLPEGDQTCLIDKGLNLSRGQKARINLARAIYKEADIYLLDDCLSAVDVLVCKHIFYKCIKSYLLNKICVLVSNQTQFLSKANNVVILSKGIVIFNGGFEKFQQWNDTSKFILNDEINNSQVESISEFGDEKYGNNENPVDNIKNLTTNSIYKESKERGSVKTRVYYKYFQQGGGLKMIILLLGLSVGSQAFSSWADYFVSFWVDMEQDASKYSTFNTTNDAVDYINLVESRKNILIQYSLVMLGAVLLKVITSFAFFIFTSKSSLNLHVLLLNNVLNAGMTFFDTNLSGNVLNRFSRDLGVIDEQIPPVMLSLTDSILTLIGSLFIVTSVSIYTLAPCLTILIILIIGKKLYLLTARSIRRLEGTTRSPVVGHLNATLEGLATIRANKAEEILKDQFDHHQNLFNSVTYMCMSTERAFGFYMSTLGFLYLLIITFSFLFMKTKSSAGEIGLAITQSFTVIDLLYIAISNWAEFEIEMTSTERVIEYIKTKPEDSSGSKVLKWTRCGKIIYENVNLYYFSSGEPILNNVSFIIQPCQKIGIVGRTGAGKSSVIFSLFKLYNVKGKISIDDIDIKDMESSFLRSNISIIPQDPVLFSGTIRTNLDPYGIHTDEDLWNALEKVKIKSIIISLNSIITDGGVNYSIGQRQLLCLARALLRKNTILVLDEATANVDSNVDQLIQNIMNTAFSNYTIITIAHRLSTIINCDKVLVMDSGKLIEYDSPSILLSHKKGMFYKMVKESVFS